MAGSPEWYYETGSRVAGPVTAAGLKDLIEQGVIGPAVRIRRGQDGPWFPADRIRNALGSIGDIEPGAVPEREPVEWYFSRQDHRKLGPVPWSMLLAMAAQGKLEPVDLVWKPGMASWVAASGFPDLMGGHSSHTTARIGDAAPSARWYTSPLARAGAAGAALMLGLVVLTGWGWIQGHGGDPGAGPVRVDDVATVWIPRPEAGTPPGLLPGSQDTEDILEDALEAVDRGDLDRANGLLAQYLARPDPRKANEARSLQREIDLARSTVRADELARGLDDEQLGAFTQIGVNALVELTLRTAELRPLYGRTLLQAFRKESDRRQRLPKGGDALARALRGIDPDPRTVEAAEPAKDDAKGVPSQTSSLLGTDDDGSDAPGKSENPKQAPNGANTLDAVLARPGAFEGRTLVLDGLYRIGTRLSKVDDPDGNALGWSLPVGSSDAGVVYPDQAKVEGRGTYLILEPGLAPMLERVFKTLKFNATTRPTYKCILTVTVRDTIVNNARSSFIEITGLEILGTCDFLQVARRRYEQAFRTVQITSQRALVAYGDGAAWVDRLGGEEKFVIPLRRKVRDLQRKIASERDQAVIARVLQSELSRVVNMAAIAQEQHRRMLAAMMGRQFLP